MVGRPNEVRSLSRRDSESKGTPSSWMDHFKTPNPYFCGTQKHCSGSTTDPTNVLSTTKTFYVPRAYTSKKVVYNSKTRCSRSLNLLSSRTGVLRISEYILFVHISKPLSLLTWVFRSLPSKKRNKDGTNGFREYLLWYDYKRNIGRGTETRGRNNLSR